MVSPPKFTMCIFKHFTRCWWYTKEWHEAIGYNKTVRLADCVETD